MAESQEGVATSRSGRLRKRSSKLADFDSSEDSDAKVSTPKKSVSDNKVLKLPSPKTNKIEDDVDADLSDFDGIDLKEDDWELPDDDNSFLNVKLPDEDFRDDQDLEGINLPPEDLDFSNEDFDVDDDVNESANSSKEEVSSGTSHSPNTSAKVSGKKGKETQNGGKKRSHRKDKGQSRFTAYMLWARETRPKIGKKYPETVNKKLGEMWQAVPNSQKLIWKSRAKRVAVRLRQGGMITTGKAKGNSQQNCTGATSSPGGKSRKNSTPSKPKKEPAVKNPNSNRNSRGSRSSSSLLSPEVPSPTAPPSSAFKVTGTSAIDVAAHMKLLGESLNNIGHKLKEHEGQIAVSGSLSVLLDSMLCVLGPLMCLTDQIEQIRGSIDPETLSAILDNIAYIMPGIVKPSAANFRCQKCLQIGHWTYECKGEVKFAHRDTRTTMLNKSLKEDAKKQQVQTLMSEAATKKKIRTKRKRSSSSSDSSSDSSSSSSSSDSDSSDSSSELSSSSDSSVSSSSSSSSLSEPESSPRRKRTKIVKESSKHKRRK